MSRKEGKEGQAKPSVILPQLEAQNVTIGDVIEAIKLVTPREYAGWLAADTRFRWFAKFIVDYKLGLAEIPKDLVLDEREDNFLLMCEALLRECSLRILSSQINEKGRNLKNVSHRTLFLNYAGRWADRQRFTKSPLPNWLSSAAKLNTDDDVKELRRAFKDLPFDIDQDDIVGCLLKLSQDSFKVTPKNFPALTKFILKVCQVDALDPRVQADPKIGFGYLVLSANFYNVMFKFSHYPELSNPEVKKLLLHLSDVFDAWGSYLMYRILEQESPLSDEERGAIDLTSRAGNEKNLIRALVRKAIYLQLQSESDIGLFAKDFSEQMGSYFEQTGDPWYMDQQEYTKAVCDEVPFIFTTADDWNAYFELGTETAFQLSWEQTYEIIGKIHSQKRKDTFKINLSSADFPKASEYFNAQSFFFFINLDWKNQQFNCHIVPKDNTFDFHSHATPDNAESLALQFGILMCKGEFDAQGCKLFLNCFDDENVTEEALHNLSQLIAAGFENYLFLLMESEMLNRLRNSVHQLMNGSEATEPGGFLIESLSPFVDRPTIKPSLTTKRRQRKPRHQFEQAAADNPENPLPTVRIAFSQESKKKLKLDSSVIRMIVKKIDEYNRAADMGQILADGKMLVSILGPNGRPVWQIDVWKFRVRAEIDEHDQNLAHVYQVELRGQL